MDPGLTETASAFRQFFLNDSSASTTAYRDMVARIAHDITEQCARQQQPYSGLAPDELARRARAVEFFPEDGAPLKEVLDGMQALVLEHNVAVVHPHCVAHLHCPPFIAGLAAEMLISAFNQSLDSWDQAPAATMLEQALCDALCRRYGFDAQADAVFTGGGTMSNFMGLLLARDHYAQTRFDWNVQQRGLPPEAPRFRILCSESAHFTVAQAASLLGLGAQAIVTVPGTEFGENAAALRAVLDELTQQQLLPIAYVSTAGTTDFGDVGPLGELADITRDFGMWFHVDAAYAGALMFSERHRHRLNGIERADSVTIDLHKLFFLPVSCGVFMVRDRSHFEYLRLHAAYLNPEGNAERGLLDLVYKSTQTTRRFDALKPILALQHVGTKRFGAMLDYTIDLAQSAAHRIAHDPRLALAHAPALNAVVFRYVPAHETISEDQADVLNGEIKTHLLLSGEAVIGQTQAGGRSCLKFTLLNPATEPRAIDALIDRVRAVGEMLETQLLATAAPPRHVHCPEG